MPEASRVKQDILSKYEQVSENVIRAVEKIEDREHLWRLVAGRTPAWTYYRWRKIETALALGGFGPGAKVLDVGCGTGDYTFLLARRGLDMTGVDLSPNSIKSARQKAAKLDLNQIPFLTSDGELLREIPGDSFDGVISFSALRYVPDLSSALKAIRRVLKPGGKAVLDFPNRHCPWFKLLKNRFGVETHIHDHHYSTREISDFFRDAGFSAVKMKRILFTPYITPPFLLPFFKLIDLAGEKSPLNHAAAIIMAKGMKP